MVDIHAELIHRLNDGVKAKHPNCFVSGEYLRSVAKLPAVTVQEESNTVPKAAIDSGTMERFADVMYQVDVYASDVSAKKTEARKIMATVDELFQALGFRRTFMRPTPNVNNATIYRITARYVARIDNSGVVMGL